MGIRDFINQKPWIGWSLAGVLLVIVVYRFSTGGTSSEGPYSPERMTQMVHIRFSDTGEETDIPRGRLDKLMRARGTVLDPTEGIQNPKTGKYTGFPFDKSDWDEMINRINKERGVVTPKPGTQSTSLESISPRADQPSTKPK